MQHSVMNSSANGEENKNFKAKLNEVCLNSCSMQLLNDLQVHVITT